MNKFYGLDTVASDRLCYGIITHDSIFRVWWKPELESDSTKLNIRYPRIHSLYKVMCSANIVVDLTNSKYIKHRNADPIKLRSIADEVKILFAHTKRYELVDDLIKEIKS